MPRSMPRLSMLACLLAVAAPLGLAACGNDSEKVGIEEPAREGLAVVAAVKATLGALRGFRDLRPRHGRTADEEDPLFIG